MITLITRYPPSAVDHFILVSTSAYPLNSMTSQSAAIKSTEPLDTVGRGAYFFILDNGIVRHLIPHV